MIEYKRKVSTLHLTDLGLFHSGQLPSTYDGPVLDIEVVHRILFLDELTGELTTMSFNPPPAKNASGVVTVYTAGEITLKTATVDEDHTDGHHYFPLRIKKLGDFFIASIESDGKSKAI